MLVFKLKPNYKMRYFLLFFSFFFLCSCSLDTTCMSKESFLSNFDKFSKDLKENHELLEESDWMSIDQEFTNFVDNCYPKFKSDLSIEEKVSFFKNTLSYGYYKGSKDGSLDIDLKLDIEGELRDLSVQGKEELKNFIKKEFGADLETAIDDLIEGIKEIGEELKDWLKD